MGNYQKPTGFSFDPNSPGSINDALLICANNIAVVTEKVAMAEETFARAKSKYKVQFAKIYLVVKGSAKVRECEAITDDQIIQTQGEMDEAEILAGMLKAHLKGWEAHYYAVRKAAGNFERERSGYYGRQ